MYSTYEMEVYAKDRQSTMLAEADTHRRIKNARRTNSRPVPVVNAARNAWNQISTILSQLVANSRANGTQGRQNSAPVECAS